MTFRQARWDEPSVWDLAPPRNAEAPPEVSGIPEKLRRKEAVRWPELSELEVVRHYTRLSQMNFGIDTATYPLGSCTMKYNPKAADAGASLPGFAQVHPGAPASCTQGWLEMLVELEEMICEITGMQAATLQPAAGAAGELTGLLLMRAYHESRGEGAQRRRVIIPDSAHGTNPASVTLSGYEVA
ncbi:MAG: aminomethyl-transferring glycine dehydrogenase subunit GcvPB, partial [Thermoplasmata archaeon]